jgi:hypothetical protein
MSIEDVRWFLFEIGPPMSVVFVLIWLVVRQQKVVERLLYLENGIEDDTKELDDLPF